jgi:hypothetical protein
MSKTPEKQREHSKKWNNKNPDYFKEYYKKNRKPEARRKIILSMDLLSLLN